MKCFGCLLLLLSLILCSCTTHTVSHDIADDTINAATALESSLSANCKTEAINARLSQIKTQIPQIIKACESEKQAIEQEKIRWKWSFLGLLFVVSVFVARRVVK